MEHDNSKCEKKLRESEQRYFVGDRFSNQLLCFMFVLCLNSFMLKCCLSVRKIGQYRGEAKIRKTISLVS